VSSLDTAFEALILPDEGAVCQDLVNTPGEYPTRRRPYEPHDDDARPGSADYDVAMVAGQQRASGTRGGRRSAGDVRGRTGPSLGAEPLAPATGSRALRRRASPLRKVDHFTVAERAARGKAARSELSRRAHGEWEPAPHRPDPVDLLEDQARTRAPELVPIRYGRMLVSPFTFYRGAAAVMAGDLADGARTGLHVQLCGDAHLLNFGIFAAPDRRLVFAINDFDETLPGPFEWDVKRLAASFAVAARERAFNAAERSRICLAMARTYRESMRDFAAMRNLDLWYARLDVLERLREFEASQSAAVRRRVETNLARARARDSLSAFAKLTELVDGERRIVSDPPLIVRLSDQVAPEQAAAAHEGLRRLLRVYRRSLPVDRRHLLERFSYVDAARKVVGVGSVGARAWIVLLLGRDERDPLFLQAKEAQPSVLEPYLGRSTFENHGQRVVEGQRVMQSASDILLGWFRGRGLDGQLRDFYVRQLWDAKGSAQVETMEPSTMISYARICGWTLAWAHARSGDAVAIASYLGSADVFDQAMAVFAERYADQSERDYAALQAAVESGRVTAQAGL